MTAPALPERLTSHGSYLMVERGSTIGKTSLAPDGYDHDALAAELARRWNAHADLVAALERLSTTCAIGKGLGAIDKTSLEGGELVARMDFAEAALKAAQGES